MQGSLGTGANLNHRVDTVFVTAAKCVGAYETIRSGVQRGDRYRVIAPEGHETSATFFVASVRRQAVLFRMLQSSRHAGTAPMLLPQGLDAGMRYRRRTLGGVALPVCIPSEASDAWWMDQGI